MYRSGARLESVMFLSLSLFALIAGNTSVHGSDLLVIPRERAVRLFSYPNNCHVICFRPQTLKQTVELWLSKSLERDGFGSTTVDVTDQDNNELIISFAGPGAEVYVSLLPKFLDAGDKAYAGALRLLNAKKWRYNWKFFLPLGLPLANQKTVELLHFPPDYVLEVDQDYLKAWTTKRWGELLVLNGVAAEESDLYQAIIDIAPISARESDGKRLSDPDLGVYGEFVPYIDAMLKFWATSNDGNVKPMVAFGGDVRGYIKQRYKIELPLLGYTSIQIDDGVSVPTVTANHPSRFYNRLNDQIREHPQDIKSVVLLGMSIAHDDLIAACWQVEMSTGDKDGKATLADCTTRWDNQNENKKICEIVIKQYFKDYYRGSADVSGAADVCNKADLSGYKVFSQKFITDLETRAELLGAEF